MIKEYMTEIGGLPPSILIAGGFYLLATKASIDLINFYFIFGIISIIAGCYMHMFYTKIWPFKNK